MAGFPGPHRGTGRANFQFVRSWARSLVLLVGLSLGLATPVEAGGRQGARGAAKPALEVKWAPQKPKRQTRKERGAQAAAQIAELRDTVYQSRDVASHELFLGKGFFRSLRGLRKGDHWIEIGPSSDARLATAYLMDTPEAEPYRFPRGKARVTGIGLEPLDPAVEQALERGMRARGVRYEHRSGRFLESYRRGEIELAQLVDDQFGAFAYTHRPQKILEIEGSLLVPGGKLHTHSSPWTRVVDRNGKDVFLDWIKATEGLELVEHTEIQRGPMSWHQIALERTEGSVRAPPLRLKRFEAGHPPMREFVWDGRPARPERAPRKRRVRAP